MPSRPCFERSWNEDCVSRLQHSVFNQCKFPRAFTAPDPSIKVGIAAAAAQVCAYIYCGSFSGSLMYYRLRLVFFFFCSLYLRVKVNDGTELLPLLPRLNSCTIGIKRLCISAYI
jgi:hypothetical protein